MSVAALIGDDVTVAAVIGGFPTVLAVTLDAVTAEAVVGGTMTRVGLTVAARRPSVAVTGDRVLRGPPWAHMSVPALHPLAEPEGVPNPPGMRRGVSDAVSRTMATHRRGGP